MKSPVVCLLGLLVFTAPASAETHHHRHRHTTGVDAHRGQDGFPITAEQGSIRINAVGEVISQPVPMIQKERNFNANSRKALSTPQPPPSDALPKQQP